MGESLVAHASRRSRRSLLSMRLWCINKLALILRRPRSGRLEGWAAIPICDSRYQRVKPALRSFAYQELAVYRPLYFDGPKSSGGASIIGMSILIEFGSMVEAAPL